MDQELVVLVDNQGNSVGTAKKDEVHNANTPLHLGFSVYVFNKQGKFLLTQRAKSKKTFPGVWSNTCCGHPAPGEKTKDAVKRRLKEELGLEVKEIELILPDFRYRAQMGGVAENEICPVFVALVDQEPNRNPKEVESFKWVNWMDFIKRVEEKPESLSSWCVGQVKKIKASQLREFLSGRLNQSKTVL